MDKRCSNCVNREFREDGERKVTDACEKCVWVKVDGNKEPSNWKPAKEGHIEHERCENCQFFTQLKHNFKVGIGYENSNCCTVFTKVTDGFVVETTPEDMCECFKRRTVDV